MCKTGIATQFNGVMYRSKTEAQYAYLFTKLGIAFAYEPENFEVGGGLGYCPDFHLLDIDEWFEVKGEMNEDDILKITGFQKLLGKKVFIGKMIAGQFQIMDLEDNDLSDELFGEYDPHRVAMYMHDAREFDFSAGEPTSSNAEVDLKLQTWYLKYVMNKPGATFYKYDYEKHMYINTLQDQNTYEEWSYKILISIDTDGWFLVRLVDGDKLIMGMPTDHIEWVSKLTATMFRTAYELVKNEQHETFQQIVERGNSKAMAVATLGHK